MKKQKHGFWVFIFSLIPGAGEMYMGFKKQGISIMLLFWGSIALASITGLGWLAMFLPVIWFYSFFNVHNLKSLSEEEFYSVDDNYVLTEASKYNCLDPDPVWYLYSVESFHKSSVPHCTV